MCCPMGWLMFNTCLKNITPTTPNIILYSSISRICFTIPCITPSPLLTHPEKGLQVAVPNGVYWKCQGRLWRLLLHCFCSPTLSTWIISKRRWYNSISGPVPVWNNPSGKMMSTPIFLIPWNTMEATVESTFPSWIEGLCPTTSKEYQGGG